MSEQLEMAVDPRDVPSVTVNPYWDIVRRLPGDDLALKYERRWEPQSYPRVWKGDRNRGRHDLCRKYAWAIPDPASLAFVAEHAGTGILEVGAGAGYWAWQLGQLGVTVLAYDQKPPHREVNHWHRPARRRGEPVDRTRPVFYPVSAGGPEVAAGGHGLTLMLCWPPYSNSMADETLRHYPGDRLIYIGESDGGCTADEAFFRQLEQGWSEVAEHRPVQWWGVHDWITVYQRQEP